MSLFDSLPNDMKNEIFGSIFNRKHYPPVLRCIPNRPWFNEYNTRSYLYNNYGYRYRYIVETPRKYDLEARDNWKTFSIMRRVCREWKVMCDRIVDLSHPVHDPLVIAMRNRKLESVKMLLKLNCIDPTIRRGHTLHIAATTGMVDIFAAVAHDERMRPFCVGSGRAFKLAARFDYKDLAVEFWDENYRVSAFELTIVHGSFELFKLMFNGLTKRVLSRDQCKKIVEGRKKGHLQIMQYLLEISQKDMTDWLISNRSSLSNTKKLRTPILLMLLDKGLIHHSVIINGSARFRPQILTWILDNVREEDQGFNFNVLETVIFDFQDPVLLAKILKDQRFPPNYPGLLKKIVHRKPALRNMDEMIEMLVKHPLTRLHDTTDPLHISIYRSERFRNGLDPFPLTNLAIYYEDDAQVEETYPKIQDELKKRSCLSYAILRKSSERILSSLVKNQSLISIREAIKLSANWHWERDKSKIDILKQAEKELSLQK